MSYRQIFDDAIGQAPPSGVDLDRVIHRQRRAARLRPVLAGIALVAVAAGTAMFATGGEERPVFDPADELAGFPEYVEGTRVIAAESAPMADRSLTVTFTPPTLDLQFYARCETVGPPVEPSPSYGETVAPSPSEAGNVYRDLGGDLVAELTIRGVSTEVGLCPGFYATQSSFAEFVASAGVEVGEPVTITVRLTRVVPVAGGGEPQLPTEGTFAVAVAAPVPFEEYEFPPRPEVLEPLPELTTEGVLVELRPDPDDPNRPVEQTVRWEDAPFGACAATQVELVSQTPGRILVEVVGLLEAEHVWWDYEQGEHLTDVSNSCEHVALTDEVTVRVEPEHMTGDWRVVLTQRGG